MSEKERFEWLKETMHSQLRKKPFIVIELEKIINTQTERIDLLEQALWKIRDICERADSNKDTKTQLIDKVLIVICYESIHVTKCLTKKELKKKKGRKFPDFLQTSKAYETDELKNGWKGNGKT